MPEFRYRLGDEVRDLTSRTLVMGILNRTPDSFFDKGLTFELDSLLQRAEVLVNQGADLLDVGGVKAGPGPEVGEAEELDRVVAPIAALHERFDVAISCDTWRASVLDALEARYPMLCGTIRDHVTQQRRPFLRFFACQEDLSHELPDTPLPDAVVSGAEPFLIVGALAGG